MNNIKTHEFTESGLPNMVSLDLKEKNGIIWVESRVADLMRVIFSGVADVLKIHQSKDTPRIGFTIKDEKGNFKFGAVLTYHEPEAEDDADSDGSWSLEFTFDEKDMHDLDTSIDNHSDVFVRCIANEAEHICYGRFRSVDIMNAMILSCIDSTIKFLDTNVTETEGAEVTLRGVFTATCVLENGVKVMTIEPGEVIKQIVKNDSAL